MSDVTLVIGEDWEGLYVDGKLVVENHTIQARVALKFLVGKKITKFSVESPDETQLADTGHLPDRL